MPKQREPARQNSSRSPGPTDTRPRSASLTPPRYGIEMVDFGARPEPRWVSGAQPGRFPYGDRLAREIGGNVDPHTIASVVVPDLPDRGVAVGGKVGLRPDAPIEVARHELAHSLGGDEALAHRAEHNPKVLRGLSMSAPPIDGWAIGFEFQTSGANNPKTYSRGEIRPAMLPKEKPRAYTARIANLDKEYTAWSKQANIGEHERVGYRIKSDNGDMEVETVAFPETSAGRRELQTAMATMMAEMTSIADTGFNEDDQLANVATLDEYRLHGIAHSNRTFTGKPQATAGFKLDKVSGLIDLLAKRSGKYGWDDYWAVRHGQHHPKPGLKLISDLNTRVARQLEDVSDNIRSLLHLIASYTIYGRALNKPTKYLKNIGNTLMVRNNLGKIFSEYLSTDEQLELGVMLGQDAGQRKIAAVFGAEDFETLRAVKVLPLGLEGGDHQIRMIDDLTVGKIFDDLLLGTDAIHAKAPDQSIGKVDEDNKFPDQQDAFDIGASEDVEHRRGILAEIRGLSEKEPYTNWTRLALMMFDLTAELNEGVVPPQDPLPQVVPNAIPQQQQQQQQQAPLVELDNVPQVAVNDQVEFIDAKEKKSKAPVIKATSGSTIKVKHRNCALELHWDGQVWRTAPT